MFWFGGTARPDRQEQSTADLLGSLILEPQTVSVTLFGEGDKTSFSCQDASVFLAFVYSSANFISSDNKELLGALRRREGKEAAGSPQTRPEADELSRADMALFGR